MQSVKHEVGYEYIHPIMNEIDRLFYELSGEQRQKQLVTLPFDESLQAIVDIFKDNTLFQKISYPSEFINKHYSKLDNLPNTKKVVMVCYSGGKDSLSVALHYRKLGYKVHLYHLRGLNKTYLDEWQFAERAAVELGMELHIESLKYSGHHDWVEHPMKNMIMMNRALTYAIRNNITTMLAVGNFRTSFVRDNAFDTCGGDCVEMWRAYENVIKIAIPGFKVHIPNKTYMTAYNVLEKHSDLLPYTISCLTPNRFRRQFRERTIKNYGVDLLDGRCGCCWKCATEYIYFTDRDILDYNERYYVHCIEILAYTLHMEEGYWLQPDEIWSHYFFYPMSKSKAKEILKNATFRTGKIKHTKQSIEG